MYVDVLQHPTVYEVNEDGGTKTFVRAHTRATAYYRWDKSVVPSTEAFPPGFRMIAHSNDAGADKGEIGGGYNLVVECCRDGTRNCESFDYLTFPVMKCDLMEIFFCTFDVDPNYFLSLLLHLLLTHNFPPCLENIFPYSNANLLGWQVSWRRQRSQVTHAVHNKWKSDRTMSGRV